MSPFKHTFLVVAALTALVASPGVFAQGTPTCADLQFTTQITSVLPQANAACKEVVMKNGEPYARFSAEIVRVSGGTVHAKFQRADGTWTDVYSFTPARSATVQIAGRNYRYRDLAPTQQLDIYLPPDRFEIATHADEESDFAATPVAVTTVVIMQAPREELPTTASFVPLVGAFGALFVALGAGLSMVRRKIWKA